MYITERTINTGLIGTKEYIENMNVILCVFLNKGFNAVFSKEDRKKAEEKLIVYGYDDFSKNKRIVLELYK